MNDNSTSLNKYISSLGLCSRREADRRIEAGRVTINGAIAKKGNRVEEGDVVKLDNKVIGKSKPKLIYIALNKPRGIVSTTDKKESKNIVDYVNHPERLFHIGRLDKPSEGLILLTNDGDIVNKILRAGNNHEKEYIVRVDKPITTEFVQKMSSGIPILGTVTKPCEVEKINTKTFRIILQQGLNRQIRRMSEYLGYEVKMLKRIRIMHITIDNLPYGKWRYLTDNEVRMIHQLTMNSNKTH